MARRGRPVVAASVLVVSLVGIGVADLVVVPPVPRPATPLSVAGGADAVSGQGVCAVGDAREGTEAAVDVVRPGEAGDAPALVAVRAFGGGRDPVSLRTPRLFPGAADRATLGPDGAEDVAGEVRWSSAPVVTARSWRIDDVEDLPSGTAAGPCVPSTGATSWTIPGVTTAGGAEARLRLANPHPSSATVAIGFLTPEGPEDPTRLRNVSVGAEDTLEIDLNEFLPEREDLAVVVEVESGRVAVEGYQLMRAAIGDVDGVSLLRAAPEPTEAWTIPWAIDGQDRRSWLWIANRTDRTAPVELTVHTAEGGVVAAGLAEVTVPPGTVRRVDLTGTFPEGEQSVAVTARSEGVPVTVGSAAELRADDPDDTGFAVQLGAEPDPVWTITGGSTAQRDDQLRLVNPGSEPATVDVTVWNGSTASQPDALSGLEVPPGSLRVVGLDDVLGDATSWAATVRATSGAVVAGHVGRGDAGDALHLVAGTGAPSAWWRTAPGTPTVRAAPGTAQRLGTELGIRPVDPLARLDDTDDDLPGSDQ